MIEALNFINQYTGLISLVATGLCSLAFWWLSSCFYSKKEAAEDKKAYEKRLKDVEQILKDHACYIRDFPNKNEVSDLNVAIEKLNGEIKTLNVKNESLEDKMDIIISRMDMLTEVHLNREERGHNG